MNDDHQMTRREYREQQSEQAENGSETIDHSRFDYRTRHERGRLNLDHEPLIDRSTPDMQETLTDQDDQVTREESLANDKAMVAEEKTQHLKNKLNQAILGLIVAIILVYLILFFVG